MTNVADVVRAMQTIAPTQFAASWDNVGLIVGDEASPVTRVLLAIDCTHAVLEEARREGCEAMVSYHPPIFSPEKRFTAGSIAFEAARANIAIYSPHTALDVADGGTNDVLADAVGMTERVALSPLASADEGVKLVTFVPEEHVDAVGRALFAAGAGSIGAYSSCSFRSIGTGTFFGEEGASPVVGQAGRLEEVAEVRLETLVPVGHVAAVVRALRAAHPYEEPAFDLVRLATPNARGMGRVGRVESAPVSGLVGRIKESLGLEHVLVAGPLDRTVSRVAVCAGSGGSMLSNAVERGAQLFLTGEMRHHDVLRAVRSGLSVVCTLHSASERSALGALRERLSALLPTVSVARSVSDREPFSVH
ncbi:MAG: Nif3-like dinuclear metal center hexameric protein [Polyangiaceae bacterium]